MNSILDAINRWADRSHHRLWMEPATSSTNEVAKSTPGFVAYATAHQTAGRGRFDRSWQDMGHGQLLISFRKEVSKTPSPFLAPRMGLALAHAASQTWLHSDWSLKAPNDLYLSGSKVAGLLVEVIQQGSKVSVVIGLGMNINSKPNVPQAGCLSDSIKASLFSPDLIVDFLDRFHLEIQLALHRGAEPLSPMEVQFLEALLIKNPIQPQVKALTAQGDLTYSDGTTKKWMEL